MEENLQKQIDELKRTKVSKEVFKLAMQNSNEKLDSIKKDVEGIQSYGKWLILLILTAIITAILNLVITPS